MSKLVPPTIFTKKDLDIQGASSSSVKPHLVRLSGSGGRLSGLVIERVMESAHAADRHTKDGPSKHVVVIPSRNAAKLTWKADGHIRSAHFAPGDIIVNPQGNFVAPSWDTEVEFLLVGLESGHLARWLEEHETPARTIKPVFNMRDELLTHLVIAMIREFEQEDNPNALYLDSLAQTVIAHLAAKYTFGKQALRPTKGRLGAQKLRQIQAYIQDHLADEVRLAHLAREVGLSSSHLITFFRRATGQSPHQYLLAQRIERAKTLLQMTKLSISEIALRTGFSDQSHLTRMMRRHAGTTPRLFREK